jgi:membrane-bound serine protease (ClpP class)
MWVVAGVLLGLVVLASLIGFHSGPHAHAAAGVAGALAAIWLVLMAISGRSSSVLWALLAADVVVSGGIGVMAWRGFADQRKPLPAHHGRPVLEGAVGVALNDLAPEGIVRTRGEEWSAVSLNGPVAAGGRVHVVRADSVRLEVLAEEAVPPAGPELFSLEAGEEGGS